MTGMRKLTDIEMNEIKGGWSFKCPPNVATMNKNIAKYKKESMAKASAYIKFCYEDCGYRG